jgi:hypothetical protein
MALFKNLTTTDHEVVQDRLGGGFQPLDTDIYAGSIKAAYAGASAGGAQNVTLILTLNGKEYRETVYVTDKTGKNWFANKQDATKKVPLPGFTILNDLCLVTTDKPLSEQDGEEKVVKVWDNEAKAEMPKSVPMLMDLVGKACLVAIEKSIVNKNVQQPNGEWVAGAETREENNIVKVFHPELKVTVPEALAERTEPDFFNKWLEKNKGNVNDKRKVKDGEAGKTGRPGQANGPPQASGSSDTAPRTSLFGKK